MVVLGSTFLDSAVLRVATTISPRIVTSISVFVLRVSSPELHDPLPCLGARSPHSRASLASYADAGSHRFCPLALCTSFLYPFKRAIASFFILSIELNERKLSLKI